MGPHPIFESDFDCLTEMDFEVVKTEAQEFDRWVTGLVDLIPTQVYISKDMLPTKTEDEKNLSKSEKRKRRLDPEQCLTTSKLAFKNLEETQMDSNLTESNINPSDLRAKFDAKMAEIREKQNRTRADRTEEEQEAIREKRKREREKQKKIKQKKTIHENGIKSPTRNDQNANQNGKIIFNKFDLIQDPVEKAKLENQRKAPLQVRAKLAAKKEQRLAELEEDNPAKAELLKERKRWKDAETRLKGEKVRDDAKLLAKSVKRREQQKKASQKKWAERTEKLDAEKRKKQENRKKNLKDRSMSKKGKSGPKGKKPGF